MDEKQMTQLKEEIEDTRAKVKELEKEAKKIRAELYQKDRVNVDLYETTKKIKDIRYKISQLKGEGNDFPAGPSRILKRAEEEVNQARTEVDNLQHKIEDIEKAENEQRASQQNLPEVIKEENAFMKFIKRIPFVRRLMKSKILDKEFKGEKREENSELTKLKQDLENASILLEQKEEKYNNAYKSNKEEQEKQKRKAEKNAPEIQKLEKQLAELKAKETDLNNKKDELNKTGTKLTQDEVKKRKGRLEQITAEKNKLFDIIDANDRKIKAVDSNHLTRKDIVKMALSRFDTNGKSKSTDNSQETGKDSNIKEI